MLSILGLALIAEASAQQPVRMDLSSVDTLVAQRLPAYLAGRAARLVGWLDDGSLLIATRFGDTEQIHRVRAPLSTREQQTFEPAGVLAAAGRPRHEGALAYVAPRGDGATALMLLSKPGTAAQALTDEHSRVDSPLWSHDGQRLAFVHHGNARDCAIELLDAGAETASPAAAATTAAAPAVPLVIAGGSGACWRLFDWSSDDQRLLLGREIVTPDASAVPAASAADVEIFTADLSGSLAPVELPHASAGRSGKGTAATVPLRARLARFAPDGHGLLLLRQGESATAEFLQLQQLEPGAGEGHALSVESARDVDLFDVGGDGHYLAYVSNDAGLSHLTLIDQQRHLDLNPAAVPPGVIGSLGFDSAGKRLAITLQSARGPDDVYVLEPESQQLTRWTRSEAGPVDPDSFIVPTLVRFPTWDRIDGQPRMLTAYAWRPVEAPSSAPAPRPVLILLRSGGGAQYRPGYDPFIQFLVRELGWVVLAPNVRGSGGFGRSFGELARGELRDDAARDVGSLLVWIGLQHELDFNHIAVLGEGYGAYLALSSMAAYGDRLIGGIAAFPPHLDSAGNLASIRRPVLFVQGRRDPDVPAYEVEQLAARLRTQGTPVQYLGAEDEGARFERRSNRDAYDGAVANFLAQLTR
jgi:dipeptidyl aminopeptidase/acylaminoacyl peptidase